MKNRWCEQCFNYGHRKWLFLGTHRTHRLYLRYQLWKTKQRLGKG